MPLRRNLIRPMTERIAVGDLVQVVYGHACDIGRVFVVGVVDEGDGIWVCRKCGASGPSQEPFLAPDRTLRNGALRSWLKRIPPLDELEGIQTAHDLDIKEPA